MSSRMGSVSNSMFKSICLAALLSILVSIPARLFLTQPIYSLMMQRIDISEGSIGSKASEDIPLADSLEEMKQLDSFSIIARDECFNYRTTLDGVTYIRIMLPNDEMLAAVINESHVERVDDYHLRLPVGTLKEWDWTTQCEEDYQIYAFDGYFSNVSYYVDMMGDFDHVPTPEFVASKVSAISYLVSVFFFLWLIRRRGVKKGRFRPELFTKKFEEVERSTIPQDDTERWILGTYAMWAGKLGDENLIAGFPKNPANQEQMRQIYARDWGITNAEEFRQMVAALTAPEGYNGTDKASYAWDWCRAMQIVGCGFFCDYFTREEMRRLSCQIGRQIQEEFTSWEDLCEHYLDGYARWASSLGDNFQTARAERAKVYQRIQRNPNSPYRLFFQMHLRENPVVTPVEFK